MRTQMSSDGRPEAILSIIIVTYNSASVLPGLLDSLPTGLLGVEDFEVIVVDNDSNDKCVELALAHKIKPKVIKMDQNAGYAAAINVGMAAARRGASLLILNPDIRLRPGVACQLLDRLNEPSVGAAVPRILAEDGATRWSLRREPSLARAWAETLLGGTLAGKIGLGELVSNSKVYDREATTEWATGAILAVSARARALVGDWDESYFLYMEEVDYFRRLRDCGFSVAYVPEAKAVHIEGEYAENPNLSALLSGNRIRYHRQRHGYMSTFLFRLSIVIGEGLRALRGSPGHRAAFLAALNLWKLPPQLQPHASSPRRSSKDLQLQSHQCPSSARAKHH